MLQNNDLRGDEPATLRRRKSVERWLSERSVLEIRRADREIMREGVQEEGPRSTGWRSCG